MQQEINWNAFIWYFPFFNFKTIYNKIYSIIYKLKVCATQCLHFECFGAHMKSHCIFSIRAIFHEMMLNELRCAKPLSNLFYKIVHKQYRQALCLYGCCAVVENDDNDNEIRVIWGRVQSSFFSFRCIFELWQNLNTEICVTKCCLCWYKKLSHCLQRFSFFRMADILIVATVILIPCGSAL